MSTEQSEKRPTPQYWWQSDLYQLHDYSLRDTKSGKIMCWNVGVFSGSKHVGDIASVMTTIADAQDVCLHILNSPTASIEHWCELQKSQADWVRDAIQDRRNEPPAAAPAEKKKPPRWWWEQPSYRLMAYPRYWPDEKTAIRSYAVGVFEEARHLGDIAYLCAQKFRFHQAKYLAKNPESPEWRDVGVEDLRDKPQREPSPHPEAAPSTVGNPTVTDADEMLHGDILCECIYLEQLMQEHGKNPGLIARIDELMTGPEAGTNPSIENLKKVRSLFYEVITYDSERREILNGWKPDPTPRLRKDFEGGGDNIVRGLRVLARPGNINAQFTLIDAFDSLDPLICELREGASQREILDGLAAMTRVVKEQWDVLVTEPERVSDKPAAKKRIRRRK